MISPSNLAWNIIFELLIPKFLSSARQLLQTPDSSLQPPIWHVHQEASQAFQIYLQPKTNLWSSLPNLALPTVLPLHLHYRSPILPSAQVKYLGILLGFPFSLMPGNPSESPVILPSAQNQTSCCLHCSRVDWRCYPHSPDLLQNRYSSPPTASPASVLAPPYPNRYKEFRAIKYKIQAIYVFLLYRTLQSHLSVNKKVFHHLHIIPSTFSTLSPW